MKLKVVFLDFDGVLNSHAFMLAKPSSIVGLDPVAVGRVNRLLRETDAEVVVSSTWRHGRSLTQLRETLAERGFVGKMRGTTPHQSFTLSSSGVIETARVRGHEIQAWLDGAPDYDLDIESFVILDDDSDMAHLMDRLVKTTFANGLTDADVDRAIEMLRKPLPLIILPPTGAIDENFFK